MPRPRRGYTRRPKRRYAWESSTFDPVTMLPGAQVSANLLSTAAVDTPETLLMQGVKIVRMIGSLRVNSIDVSLSVEWAAGITVVGKDADQANAIPDPVTDTAHGWMWWMSRVSPPPGAGGTSIQIDLDIKSQRRLRSQDRPIFVIDNHDGFETLEFALALRVLVQLP